MPEITQAQKAAVLGIVSAVADAIRDLGEVPSGHLYATLMGHMSLNTYESIIGFLVREGFITRSGHVLKWIKQ